MNRRQFLGAAGLAGLGLAFYSGEYDRHALVIQQQSILLPNLAGTFHGTRIVQVSDIHFDEFTEPAFVGKVIAQVNALKPDIVVFTGDYISRSPRAMSYARKAAYRCADVLQHLECPVRYAVMGNHDAVVGAATVTDALVTHGIPVLANRSVPIERDNRRFWLAGVEDVYQGQARLDLAIPRQANRQTEPVILLAHEPDFADYVDQQGGVDLMLAGHTHGGQVRLPLIGATILPPLGRKYVEGHFRVGRTQLYVNRGVGTVGLPLRFRCPPEITVHTLTSA